MKFQAGAISFILLRMFKQIYRIDRRRVLRSALIAFFAVVFSGFAYALLASMQPGAHTRAQYATIVEIPEDRMGQKWWNFPVHDRSLWIVFPDAKDLTTLKSLDAYIANPAKPALIKDANAWAFWGESTYLGCWVVHRPDIGDWRWYWPRGQGGLIDPCHHGQWDMAGRAVGYGQSKNDAGYLLKNLTIADVEYLGDGKFLVYRNLREPRP